MTKSKDQPFWGIVYVCMAFFFLTAMQALNKLLTGRHNVIEIAFYRNLVSLTPCLLYVLYKGETSLLKTRMPWALTGRVLVGTTGLILTFTATQILPLSNATVIFFTSTLILPVLAHFILNEHIGKHRWFAIFFGMSGVVLVTQPSAEVTLVGVLIALGAATIHAAIQVFLRIMKHENPFTITFYFFLGGVVITGIVMPFFASVPTLESSMILIAVGGTGGMGQYYLTRAFQKATASLLSPFNYTGLLWAVTFDMIFWNYIPTWTVYMGGMIIILSHFYIIQVERLKRKKKQKEQPLSPIPPSI